MDSIKKKLVLVVDDVEQNVAVVSQILRSHGYGVMAAFNGETALRMLEKRIPDLILLDIMMPVMDGFEVCAKIKENENLKNIPIIFLSALSDTDVKVKAFNVGGVDYVSKPFQEAEVIARVAVHIKIANLEREQREFIEKLTIMNDEKDRLMQIVSHDLRSPLGGIK
ncbi:MAG TPA: response regulator, partial [Candidatus Kapabacteria bacterium]|nr:response regulator [Candidatus Kapabacteria bacterium]